MNKYIFFLLVIMVLSVPIFGQNKANPTKSSTTSKAATTKAVPTKAVSAKATTKATSTKSGTTHGKTSKAATSKGKASKVISKVPSAKIIGVSRISSERNSRLIQRYKAQNSLVVLKNSNHLLPLNRLDTLKIIVVSIGMGEENPMPQVIGRYIKADYLNIAPNTLLEDIHKKLPKSAFYNLVILAVNEQNSKMIARQIDDNITENNSSGIEVQMLKVVENLLPGDFAKGTKAVYMLFGSPLFLERWSGSDKSSALVATDKADYDRIDLSTQLIFGAIRSTGKLTFDLNKYKKGDGITYPAINRLSYVLPEELGIDSLKLVQIMDSLVGIGLKERAFPGCQMLLAKKGKVFYQKSFGFHTYDHSQPVQNDDLYD